MSSISELMVGDKLYCEVIPFVDEIIFKRKNLKDNALQKANLFFDGLTDSYENYLAFQQENEPRYSNPFLKRKYPLGSGLVNYFCIKCGNKIQGLYRFKAHFNGKHHPKQFQIIKCGNCGSLIISFSELHFHDCSSTEHIK